MTGEIPTRIAPQVQARLNNVIARLESGSQTNQTQRLTRLDLEWVTREMSPPYTYISHAEALECLRLAKHIVRMMEE